MNLAVLLRRLCVPVLVAGFAWGLGCASIIGADEYKVASGTGTGGTTGPTTTGTGATTTSSTTGGMCLDDSADCGATPNQCCSGNCFQNPRDNTDGRFCAASCNTGADCASGCCALFNGRKSCSPKGFCADTCVDIGNPCDHPAECCLGNWCVTDGTNTACVPLCQTVADCAGVGCCFQLPQTVQKVCLPDELCP